eukprot:7912740-Pyramimonas_sp.AAC.1
MNAHNARFHILAILVRPILVASRKHHYCNHTDPSLPKTCTRSTKAGPNTLQDWPRSAQGNLKQPMTA